MKVIQHIDHNGGVTFLLDTNQGDPVVMECIMGFDTPNAEEQAQALDYYIESLNAEIGRLNRVARSDRQ